MSLVAFGLRISLLRSFRGKTMAEDRIFDSLVTPIDQTVLNKATGGGGLPVITVATDDDAIAIRDGSLQMPAKRELDIVVEWAIATFVQAGDRQTIEIPHTDAGIEAALNFMHRQIMRAMLDREADPWADLFWQFATLSSDAKVLVRRGADSERGARYGARQMILTVDPLHEPPFGHVPEKGTPFAILAEMMQRDDELSALGKLYSDMLQGAPMTEWASLAAQFGISLAGLHGIGLGPLGTHGDPVSMTEIAIDDATGSVSTSDPAR